MVRSSKMFRPIVAVFALVAVASAQPDFINKCSLSAPDLEQCFVKNGNLALDELAPGLALLGFDLGDHEFVAVEDDLSLLLENGTAYFRDVKLESVGLKFGSKKDLKGLEMSFSIADVYCLAKYQAVGNFGTNKVDEIGSTQINFGKMKAKYTIEFKRKEVAGEYYLQIYNIRGNIDYEKFEFISMDVEAEGEELKPEQFQLLKPNISLKFQDISAEFVSFVFDKFMGDIPEKEIFLP